MKNFDVVIIGGGPSGSSLGYMLITSGVSVCIIEKETFPRFKLCGGLLTEKTVELIEDIYNEPFQNFKQKISDVAVYMDSSKIIDTDTKSTFALVERMDFDKYLIDKYKKSGGTLMEKSYIHKIDINKQIIETNNGEKINFKMLVGADGANSWTRKLINSKYRPNGFCIESTFQNTRLKNKINLFFNLNNSGYTWIFPKGNSCTVGVGEPLDRNQNIVERFDEFISDNVPYSLSSKRGAFISYGKYVKTPAKNNILLLGDAAGLVDPITGEGIYFALKSAQLAKDSIMCTKHNNYMDTDIIYNQKIKIIHKKIEDGNFLNKIVFNRKLSKRAIFKLLRGKSDLFSYICKNIISNYNTSYRYFAIKYLLGKNKNDTHIK
ncbi:geranylgeranyl reductase family protein [Clostridium tyrobutyricum]|uniref:NAD(P)/FAD-dependent oxidoreductase n=1 Tax=Clostridium tyrobutyricum TaxID=1519 RepID=UPI001C384C6A|nr:geranylgeranyl reductase family protein [Clostridium tyrobutyricum]MBV4420453.1 geranylgeranyl reductase family protein [Clostridium tyrobutyricum]